MYFVLISLVFLILLYNYCSLDSEEEQNHECAPDHPHLALRFGVLQEVFYFPNC